VSHAIAAMPGWLAILVTAGAPVLMALGLGQVMQAVFTPQEFLANAQVGAIKYSFMVEIYAVVAALALVGAWDIYQTARDTLQKEASGLYLLALSVDAFDGPAFQDRRVEMRGAIRAYAGAVVSQDWPAMQAGQPGTGSEPPSSGWRAPSSTSMAAGRGSRRCSRRSATGSSRWGRRGSPASPSCRARCQG